MEKNESFMDKLYENAAKAVIGGIIISLSAFGVLYLYRNVKDSPYKEPEERVRDVCMNIGQDSSDFTYDFVKLLRKQPKDNYEALKDPIRGAEKEIEALKKMLKGEKVNSD